VFNKLINALTTLANAIAANAAAVNANTEAQLLVAAAVAKLNALLDDVLTPHPVGFTATLSQPKGDLSMTPPQGEPRKLSASLTIADDGSKNLNVMLNDTAGLPIKTYSSWPAQVAQPIGGAGDSDPGPSAFVFSPIQPPTLNPDGSFVVANVTCAQPVKQPPAENVDITVTIPSGLTGQTEPITEDAGTLSIIADENAPGGFSTQIV